MVGTGDAQRAAGALGDGKKACRDWHELYRLHGPQRPYAARPGLTGEAPTGEIEYASGTVLRLADLFPPRPNWRESTDGTLRESMRQRPQNAPGREEGAE